jgi:hypothetical protein
MQTKIHEWCSCLDGWILPKQAKSTHILQTTDFTRQQITCVSFSDKWIRHLPKTILFNEA